MSYGILVAPGNGGAQFIRGVFSLAPKGLGWTCSGSVTFQPPDVLAGTCTAPAGFALRVTTNFSVDQSGAVSGQIQTSAATGQSSSGHST
jgi:hypothetical protein